MTDTRKKIPKESGFNFLLSIPNERLFCLPVDGYLHKIEQGCLEYEKREPNSVANFLKAIFLHEEAVGEQKVFSKSIYKDIHKICRTKNLIDVPAGKFIAHENHGFEIYSISLEGFYDLCRFANKYPQIKVAFFDQYQLAAKYKLPTTDKSGFNILLTPHSVNQMLFEARLKASSNKFLYMVSITESMCEKIVDDIFERLNINLKESKTDAQLITAIVDCFYDLEHLHPFKDVNLRTNLVSLNLLLMKYGFPPVMLEDPNLLDGYSKAEFCFLIKQAMFKTLDVIQAPDKPHFDFSPKNWKKSEKELYDKMIAPIIEIRKDFEFKLDKNQFARTQERIKALPFKAAPKMVINANNLNIETSRDFDMTFELREKYAKKIRTKIPAAKEPTDLFVQKSMAKQIQKMTIEKGPEPTDLKFPAKATPTQSTESDANISDDEEVDLEGVSDYRSGLKSLTLELREKYAKEFGTKIPAANLFVQKSMTKQIQKMTIEKGPEPTDLKFPAKATPTQSTESDASISDDEEVDLEGVLSDYRSGLKSLALAYLKNEINADELYEEIQQLGKLTTELTPGITILTLVKEIRLMPPEVIARLEKITYEEDATLYDTYKPTS